jgi:hypothetical protein
MKRRRWLALAPIALAAAVALWPRDSRPGLGTFERVRTVVTREQADGPDNAPVEFVRSEKDDVITTCLGPDGRPVRVKILAFVPRPTFWEWVRSWLSL